jgi:hypothetical protein
VNDEFHKPHRLDLLGVLSGNGRINRCGINVKAHSRSKRIDCGQAGEQGDDREHVEKPNGLNQRPSDLLVVGHRVNAARNRAEHDRRDHHFDELHEDVAEGLHCGPELRPEMTNQNSETDAQQDLHVKLLIQLLWFAVPDRCLDFHSAPPRISAFLTALQMWSCA